MPRDPGGIWRKVPSQEDTQDLLEAPHDGGASRRLLQDGF